MNILNENSERLYVEATQHLVGGVNSPVRAYRDFDFAPPFIVRAKGSHIWDADGNDYIDYVGSWGPMILGHAHFEVVKAVQNAAEMGTSFGAPTEAETLLAEIVKDAFPSIDLIRFVSSGTEATMSAIRAARGYTGRDKIIKFAGCYHGHSDYLLVKAGSGAATFGEPDSAGVPEDFAKHTLVAEYNDLNSVERLADRFEKEIAAIIVEPIAGNMGCVPPASGFLEGLREICDKIGAVLIFDEVITGFRVAYGGAQELYGVKPDLTCLGKILGGGLPMGAYGGKKEIMEMVSPLGPVYQAGTLSGNPMAVAAGIVTLKILRGSSCHCEQSEAIQSNKSKKLDRRVALQTPRDDSIYIDLEQKSSHLTSEITKTLTQKDIPHKINRVGSIFSIFFESHDVFKRYFVHLLGNGIYIAPSPYESAFVGTAHTDEDISRTVDIIDKL